jgi:large subunit ribosomal protein L10
MAISKTKKAELIAKYSEILSNNKTLVYINFKKFNVKNQDLLRKQLKSENGNLGYVVVKKTLWDIANKNAGITGESITSESEMAVIYGEDLLSPAKIALETQKSNKEKSSFVIIGGIFDKEYKTKDLMIDIANIPSKEVLLSQLAFLLKSPMQRIAIAINEVAKTKN